MNNKKIINAEILEVLEDDEYICCKSCGLKHLKTTSNCCWITCKCGKYICGNCGKFNVVDMDRDTSENSDDNYWCCLKCDDCGLIGCGMCV